MKDICIAVYEYLMGIAEINSVIQGRLYPEMLPEDGKGASSGSISGYNLP